jgi:hypothetical protein
MSRDPSKLDESLRDDALVQRVREHLDNSSTLSAAEAARLSRARRQARAGGERPRRSVMPAYGLAMAASVTLVAALWLMGPAGLEPLPPQLAQLDEQEWLLVFEEPELAGEPEFLAWALDERDG